MREVLVIFGVVVGFFVLVACGRMFDLYWFPWEVHMKTEMIRNSNSYVTTQQTALRQLRSSYDDAMSVGQKNSIIRQMREIADLIPNDVQPDIRLFLNGNR